MIAFITGISSRIVLLIFCIFCTGIISLRAQDSKEKKSDRTIEISTVNTSNLQSSSPQTTKAIDLLPTERVGVDKNKVLKLTLQNSILMSLKNNTDIEVERENVQISKYNFQGAHGPYDPLLGGTLNYSRSIDPVAQTFIGALGGSRRDKTLLYNFQLNQLLPFAGSYKVSFENTRQETTVLSAGLNPQYFSSFKFEFRQPLLRNFGLDQSSRILKISKKQVALSDSTFRQRAINTVARVQSAYWDLVYAIRNNQITRDAVDLADITLHNNQRQVEVGTLAPIEVVSAQAELESRKDAAILALQQITTTENNLKILMFGDPTSDDWNARIEPLEQIEFPSSEINLNSVIESAFQNRPELEQIHLQQEIKDIDLKFFRNQQKPQIDFTSSFSLAGLGGQKLISSEPAFSSSSILNSTTLNFNNRFTAFPGIILNQSSSLQPETNSRFIGGYGTALQNLGSFDFNTYTFGLSFNFPIRNREARANFGRTIAENRQLQTQEKQIRQTIQVEVRNAVQTIVSAKQRIEAARAARIAAEVQLKGEEQKYAAGVSSNFLVLDRQNRLSAARGNEIRALTDYNKSVSELQRVTSTSLIANGVQIEQLKN